MLNFLVDQFTDRWPDLLGLPEELSDVIEASAVDFAVVNTQFREFDALMKRLKAHVAVAEPQMLEGNMFVPKYNELMETHQARLETLRKNIEEIQPFFKTILELYGEDTPTNIPDFLSSFGVFVAGFKKVKAELVVARQAALKNAKRQERLQAKAQPQEKPAEAEEGERPREGLLDNAVNTLLHAQPQRALQKVVRVAKFAQKLRRNNRPAKKSLDPVASKGVEMGDDADEFKTLG